MKFKSKSLISIILSIMMVISMIIVAIPANAAVIDSEPVGADTTSYYLWYGVGTDSPSDTWTKKDLINESGSVYSADWTVSEVNKMHTFIVSTNSSKANDKDSSYWTSSKKPSIVIDEKYKSTYFNYIESQERDGYGIVKFEVKYGQVAKMKLTFNSSYGTITISEAGSTPKKYNITSAETSSGTFNVNKSTAAENETVTVSTTPDSGYEVDRVTYTPDGGSAATVSGSNNTYTFKMPAYAVTVNVTFKKSTTPTTSYYIGGRFKVKGSDNTSEYLTYDDNSNNFAWNASCTNSHFKFIEDSSNAGWYYLDTNLTVSELSAQLSGKNDKGEAMSADPYFLIHTGNGDSGTWYGANSDNAMHSLQNTKALPSVSNLTSRTSKNEEKYLIKFSGTQSTIAGNVTLHFNPTELKLYYTTDGSSTSGDFKIVDKTDANGKLTFSAPNKPAGTADAGDTVTITGTPLNSYYELSNVSVTYKVNKTEVSLVASNTDGKFTFAIPSDLDYTTVKDATISVKGTFTLTSTGKLDYVKAQGAGLYIDVAPTKDDTTATLIKWNNYQGSNHGTSNPYTFYVPKNVDLANAVIYNTTGGQITLGGKTINNNDKAEGVKLTTGNNTITNCSTANNVVVMQGSTDAMFLNTTKEDGTDFDLPTAKNWPNDYGITDKQASDYKATIKSSGGSCTTMDNTSGTAKFSSAMGLDTVKGRGNSSWKASATMFGKYAFNMKLKSKTNLLGMDSAESSGAKSWCLLANNADESMLRNALTYQLASEIGLLYSPEFRFVDIYDNGEYMGSYLVTEKVDVGSSKLVKGISYDDINEDYAKASGLTEADPTETTGKYTYDGKQYDMKYTKVTADGNTENVPYDNTVTDAKLKGKYLLEFEITERFDDEASWFTSPRGQHVVVKSPEYATKQQVTYIAQKFAAMEDIAFTAGATKAQLSTVMDVASFAKMYLIQEFSSNLDAASTSYYLTFDCSQENPVFVANPVWDYDWAYGQYKNDTKKGKVGNSEYTLNTKDAGSSDDSGNYWVAKYKLMDDSKGNNGLTGYSIQSQLASQNPDFKAEIRKQWEGTNGFYAKIKGYYGTNGKIDTWFNLINASVEMNETRWNFIHKDPISSWGSVNTGDNHTAAVTSLNNWTSKRATWLNAQFTDGSEYAPFTPAAPVLTVTDENGIAKTSFEVGESILINVTTVEDGVTYSVYHGDTVVDDNVKNGKIQIVATADMVGEQTFTVKATYGEKVATSTVNVIVNTSSVVKNITVYFKTATAPAYAPSVSFDGGDAKAMTNPSELGKDYSGSLTFAWYSVTINDVDTTKTHTLTFTSKRTKLNATWNGTLTTDSYFTADNLMRDTVAVNLTDEHPIKRNFFYSATNMVYDSTDAKNKTLGFTFVGGSRVKMGTVVNESNGTVTPVSAPTVKSATYIQMINASMITVSSLQSELYDVNFDGKVDIKDATYIQYALAS